ncbi:MAG: hypothetical protein HY398_01080 [Candidatus Doudnabacteria bacterium]|nr:hypothetical protein [Candidatus Doudnabacteria bacterium]
MARGNHKSYRMPLNYSIPRAILDILLDVSEHSGVFDTPYQRMKRSWRKLQGAPEPTMVRYNRAIKYLQARKELRVRKAGDRIFLKLTKKGKLKALLLRLYRDFDKKVEWDGKWRLVMWDIPESSSHERDKIRNLLKDLEFYQLQKSVFISPRALPNSAVEFLKESELMKYIRFLRVDKMENDRFFRRHFQL